jgi:hypothetical protein
LSKLFYFFKELSQRDIGKGLVVLEDHEEGDVFLLVLVSDCEINFYKLLQFLEVI